jgi:hypothetical protein
MLLSVVCTTSLAFGDVDKALIAFELRYNLCCVSDVCEFVAAGTSEPESAVVFQSRRPVVAMLS